MNLLLDHTYRSMLLGTVIIGFTAGALGTFAYLRKQSLLADVVSHSAIGGTMLAFMVASWLGFDGRASWVLIIGASVISLVALALIEWLPQVSVTKVDAAMAIMLALFFGGGMVLHRVILGSNFANKGGLVDYLFGSASHLTFADIASAAVVAVITFTVAVACFKELTLGCFDAEYATTLGYSPKVLSVVLNTVVVLSVVIGVKAVGLVLMIALAVAPPIAARQWTRRVGPMVVLSGVFGALGAALGAWISVSIGRVPTGPVIVLVLTAIAAISLLFAPRRSLLLVALSRRRQRLALSGGQS
ncbi:MAG: metal ABC transporter permease [Propionibacteriaceae bacterium]|nr:metal ABC transporter permease [Propionibacteriaceae bacterium]